MGIFEVSFGVRRRVEFQLIPRYWRYEDYLQDGSWEWDHYVFFLWFYVMFKHPANERSRKKARKAATDDSKKLSK